MDFSPQHTRRVSIFCIMPMLGVGLLTLLLVALEAAYAPPAQAAERAEFSCAEVTYVPQSECEALVDLYNATGGPAWTNLGGPWMVQQVDAPCNWLGVDCEFGHVVKLALTNKGLFGTLPGDVIARLPELIDLSLGLNDLSGPIPPEIGDLAYLKRLFLSNNRFSGEIPQGILGHKSIPDISKYHGTQVILYVADNDLTGTLPADLGIPLTPNAIRQMQVHRNPLLQGPIPVEYAGAIEVFGFQDTGICVPRDEAVTTWLEIPRSGWDLDPRLCPRDAAVHVRVEAGANVKVNGEVVSGTVTVDQDLRVECDPLRQVCAKVELECSLGQTVMATIINLNSYLQEELLHGDLDLGARMNDFDTTTTAIMKVLELSPQSLAEACAKIMEKGVNPNLAISGVAADEALLVVDLEQGAIEIETPQAGIGVQVQTTHAVIDVAALATGEVAVDPAVGTVLVMRTQTATITPTVGGAAREVSEQQGIVIFDDGLVYPFDVQLPFYIPLLVKH